MYPPDFGSISLKNFPLDLNGRPDTQIIVPNKIPDWAWSRLANYDDAPQLQADDDIGLASWLYSYSSSVRHLFPAGKERAGTKGGQWGTSVDEDGKLLLRTVIPFMRAEDVDWVAGVLGADVWIKDREVKFVKLSFEEASARILARLGIPGAVQRKYRNRRRC
jgi:hypothetical protein